MIDTITFSHGEKQRDYAIKNCLDNNSNSQLRRSCLNRSTNDITEISTGNNTTTIRP